MSEGVGGITGGRGEIKGKCCGTVGDSILLKFKLSESRLPVVTGNHWQGVTDLLICHMYA